jgi:phosphatidylglycerophosphate synthase
MLGLPPQTYTWLILPCALFGFIAIINQYILTGTALYIISAIFDVIDGAIKRYREDDFLWLKHFDYSIDRFVDFIIIFSYFWLPLSVWWMNLSEWLLLTYFFAIMPSLINSYAGYKYHENAKDTLLSWRLINRGERYLLMLVIPIIAAFNSIYAGYMLMILAVLSALTTLQTMMMSYYLTKQQQ